MARTTIDRRIANVAIVAQLMVLVAAQWIFLIGYGSYDWARDLSEIVIEQVGAEELEVVPDTPIPSPSMPSLSEDGTAFPEPEPPALNRRYAHEHLFGLNAKVLSELFSVGSIWLTFGFAGWLSLDSPRHRPKLLLLATLLGGGLMLWHWTGLSYPSDADTLKAAAFVLVVLTATVGGTGTALALIEFSHRLAKLATSEARDPPA